tara:strand:- start:279 stop:452 length:174 start_codon:yes stop_codon:yes gene_type:complete
MKNTKEEVEGKRLTHSEVTKCIYDLRVRGEWFNNPTYIDLINQLAIIEQGKSDELKK